MKLSEIFSLLSKEITEKDVERAFEELELELLSKNITLGALEKIKEMARKVVGKKCEGKKEEFIKRELKRSILESLPMAKFELPEERPVKILFVGPNGHGKTTTIVKLAYMFRKKGKRVLIAASDTFRAAAIEQLEGLARKAGAKVVRGKYGDSPVSIARNAVKSAIAREYDVVLIDTAGRSELNLNLLEEMRKMQKVVKPHITIFVGEATAGHALIEQIRRFQKVCNIDYVILTKCDVDRKKGMLISVPLETGLPIAFLGTGQGIEDLKPFTPASLEDVID